MPSRLHEFGVLAGLHLLAVATPGPDFAMVVRQSLAWDRVTAVRTSLGIGLGILFHSVYCLLGLGLLLAQSDTAFLAAKGLGAAYLAWIGITTFRATDSRRAPAATNNPDNLSTATGDLSPPSPTRAVLDGFLTNALNPKAAFFFLALFSVVVSAETPMWLRATYCGWMAVTTFLWFACVSIFFSREKVRRSFLSWGPWLGRILGVAFLALAAKLALAVAH